MSNRYHREESQPPQADQNSFIQKNFMQSMGRQRYAQGTDSYINANSYFNQASGGTAQYQTAG